MGVEGRLPVLSSGSKLVVMARHGQTDDNLEPLRFQGRSDTPLNSTGEAQAEFLAEIASGLGFQAVWTSDLARAKSTADAVARRIGVEPVIDPRLSEGDRGRWEGLLMSDVSESEPQLFAQWRAAGDGFRFPGGETLVEHQDRVASALVDIDETGLSTLVVCHGGSIRTVLCARSGAGLGAFHEWDVPNCCLVRL